MNVPADAYHCNRRQDFHGYDKRSHLMRDSGPAGIESLRKEVSAPPRLASVDQRFGDFDWPRSFLTPNEKHSNTNSSVVQLRTSRREKSSDFSVGCAAICILWRAATACFCASKTYFVTRTTSALGRNGPRLVIR